MSESQGKKHNFCSEMAIFMFLEYKKNEQMIFKMYNSAFFVFTFCQGARNINENNHNIYIFNQEMEPKVPVKAFSVLFFTFFRPKNYKQIAFKTCT